MPIRRRFEQDCHRRAAEAAELAATARAAREQAAWVAAAAAAGGAPSADADRVRAAGGRFHDGQQCRVLPVTAGRAVLEQLYSGCEPAVAAALIERAGQPAVVVGQRRDGTVCKLQFAGGPALWCPVTALVGSLDPQAAAAAAVAAASAEDDRRREEVR